MTQTIIKYIADDLEKKQKKNPKYSIRSFARDLNTMGKRFLAFSTKKI